MTLAPRWLRLTLLPVLAIAVWFVDDRVQAFVWRIANKAVIAEIGLVGKLLGAFFGPLVTASLFAYPIARLYPRYSKMIAVLIASPVLVSGLYSLAEFAPEGAFLFLAQLISLCIFMPVVMSLVQRELMGSQLLVSAGPVRLESSELGSRTSGLATPRWLLLAMLPISALVLSLIHFWLQFAAFDVAFIAQAKEIQQPALILAAFIAPALTALAFAYPIARLYGRHSALAGALISAPTSLYWALAYVRGVTLPWVVAAFVIVAISLIVLVPSAAARVRRQLGDSQLVLASCEQGDPKHDEIGPCEAGVPGLNGLG